MLKMIANNSKHFSSKSLFWKLLEWKLLWMMPWGNFFIKVLTTFQHKKKQQKMITKFVILVYIGNVLLLALDLYWKWHFLKLSSTYEMKVIVYFNFCSNLKISKMNILLQFQSCSYFQHLLISIYIMTRKLCLHYNFLHSNIYL